MIPSEIGQLQALTHLELHFNQLTTIPSEIGQCQSLFWFTIQDNPDLVIEFVPVRALTIKNTTCKIHVDDYLKERLETAKKAGGKVKSANKR